MDFLRHAGQRWWQMLPIHPPGGGNSPYDSPSAFAGAEALISLEDLVPLGLLDPQDFSQLPASADPLCADFELGRTARATYLQKAHDRFVSTSQAGLAQAYQEFLHANSAWVWDYALFSALRDRSEHPSWETWDVGLRTRQPQALSLAHKQERPAVLFRVFCQFLFHYQWDALRLYAKQRGVHLMGDIPMFVAHNSADVWANQGLFYLDGDGRRTVQAGVPPDYFSADGQLWGNPLYRWDVMRQNDYGWWLDRLRRELAKFDAVRIDHFIALSRYWEVPIGAQTAKDGRYVSVDGAHFLERARQSLGGLPFVAEDLGVLTPEVEALRDSFELPGMRIMHFAFFDGAESYLPHRHPKRTVAYLGTHDNNTTRGWYAELASDLVGTDPDRAHAARGQLHKLYGYTGVQHEEQCSWTLLRFLLASPADIVMLTMQDLLNQGAHARMNIPGVGSGNWAYRLPPACLTHQLADEVRTITQATERLRDC